MRASLLGGFLLLAACSGSPSADDSSNNDAGNPNDSTTPTDSPSSTDGPAQDVKSDVGSGADASDGSIDNSPDGFGAARTACINEINKLRATEGHAAYMLWETAAIDTCVDEQATYDQAHSSAHDAWLNKVYPTCNGNAQDECLGYGTSPSEVVACLDSMWNERLQSNCVNCPNCNSTTLDTTVLNCENTPTCDFYGTYDPTAGECGHYCNMSADYFTYAACGFSTAGTTKDWAVQNFK